MQNNSQQATWRFFSFPPSNGCDLSRWLLRHYGIAFHQQEHTIPFLQIAQSLAGGKASGMPVVCLEKVVLNSANEVLDHFEPLAPDTRKLLPKDLEQKSEVKKLWHDFYNGIGFAAARWAYDKLLPQRELMLQPITTGCPWFEKLFVQLAYPLSAILIRKGLGISPQTVEEAMPIIINTFDRVDALLAGGKEFLVGDQLTAADICFASMAVPVIWPPEYEGAVPSYESLLSEMKKEIVEFRKRPAGQFALKLYQDYYSP